MTQPASPQPAAALAQADLAALINPWQRVFPLTERPFDAVAQRAGRPLAEVLRALRQAQAGGAISRIGAVFDNAAGGASLLAAVAVPPERLESVAALVSAQPGVNHNYQREDALNLWFVATAADEPALEATLRHIEQASGLPVLRLRMQRAYRIDLALDLTPQLQPPAAASGTPMPAAESCATPASPRRPARALRADERPLAALAEAGLAIEARPFDPWARALGRPLAAVLHTLRGWQDDGLLRRFGIVVRHHELGIAANAMTVWNVPDDQADAAGERLARQPGVTLAYRRNRAEGWPFNLYAMVHGRERPVVLATIAQAAQAAGLGDCPSRVLFSTRRFKQTGGQRFAAAVSPATQATPLDCEVPA